MNTNPKRIVWMLDETLVKSAPGQWPEVRQQMADIIKQIGNPGMEHLLADPEPLLHHLGEQLAGQQFSAVVDLSGWMSKTLENVLNTRQISRVFRLSRIREASSPDLPTSGHITSLDAEQRKQLINNLDLNHPLIIDDASFSGTTSLLTMQLLGIDPEKTTHAFLITNTGELGENPGAKMAIESTGGKVLSGMTINTPDDDGWHTADTWNHQRLTEAISLSILSQEIMKTHGINSNEAKAVWFAKTFLETQFINRIQPETARQLISEGRLIANNPHQLLNGEVHTTNPLLWISPYFIKHIDLPRVQENRETISQQLERVKSITDSSNNQESILELKRSVENHLWGRGPERKI